MASSECPAIGIDLGTTYSCVAVYTSRGLTVIPTNQGQRIMPSCVSFTNMDRLVGVPAKDQACINSKNTVYDVKRLIGCSFDDENVQPDINRLPFSIISDNGKPQIEVTYRNKAKRYDPEDISAMVLEELRRMACKFLGQTVKSAVITIPAYFNDSQRQATKTAALIAGFEQITLISEPTAAALAYGHEKRFSKIKKEKRNVLVYDLGGGTFDVCILTISNDTNFEVRSVAGNVHLGGTDFDDKLVNHFIEKFSDYFSDANDKTNRLRLKEACEKAKRDLSNASVASVIFPISGGMFHQELTKSKFENLCLDLFEDTLQYVEKALEDAKMNKEDIDDIVMVGGSTRIPLIQELVRDFFNREELIFSIHPDEAVAYGAAIKASLLSPNPCEEIKDIVLVDVTPFSLGILTIGDKMNFIIKRNTSIPCEESHGFTTPFDYQKSILFTVFQGERLIATKNTELGEFRLHNIEIAPREVPKIQVTFSLDENGILEVSAFDKKTGSSNKIEIRMDNRHLTEEEIKCKIFEAERYRQEELQTVIRNKFYYDFDYYLSFVKRKIRRSTNELSTENILRLSERVDFYLDWLDCNKQSDLEKLKAMKMKASLEFADFK